MEALVDDPIFIAISLLLRTYFPVLICYEVAAPHGPLQCRRTLQSTAPIHSSWAV